MKRIMGKIALCAVGVIIGITITFAGTQLATSQTESIVTVDGKSMLVLSLEDGDYFLQAIRGTHQFEVEGNKLYMDDGIVVVNDLSKVNYALYPDQIFEIPVEEDEFGDPVEVPVTLAELNLREVFLISDLSSSPHLARIKSIDITKAKPITVIRTFAGREFDVPCVVTEQIKDQFLAGNITVGDIVIVECCEERPEDAIVIAKVYKSW